MALQRIYHAGAAAGTTLNGSISAGATSLALTAATGWPSAPFVAKLDAGTAAEEKVLVGARSGTACSSLTRGYDGTTATSHSSGATVEHDLGANVVDDLNDHVYTPGRDDHNQYARVDGTRAFTGPVTINGALTVTGGITGTSGMLAVVSYSPGSPANPSTLSTTPTQVDPTNLTVSFTAPASGKVMIHLSAIAQTAGTGSSEGWALIGHGGSTQYGPSVYVASATNGVTQRTQAQIFVTGLTGGTGYQFDWAYFTSSASYGVGMTYGGVGAPAVIEVFGL